jgi:hypothetical protein
MRAARECVFPNNFPQFSFYSVPFYGVSMLFAYKNGKSMMFFAVLGKKNRNVFIIMPFAATDYGRYFRALFYAAISRKIAAYISIFHIFYLQQ